jgi:hypothetical protein
VSHLLLTQTKGQCILNYLHRIEKVPYAMYGRDVHSKQEKQKVYRTAWKNIHDWIDAQLALVKTSMVKLEGMGFHGKYWKSR